MIDSLQQQRIQYTPKKIEINQTPVCAPRFRSRQPKNIPAIVNTSISNVCYIHSRQSGIRKMVCVPFRKGLRHRKRYILYLCVIGTENHKSNPPSIYSSPIVPCLLLLAWFVNFCFKQSTIVASHSDHIKARKFDAK